MFYELLLVIGLPVAVAVTQEYFENRYERSRKRESACPPHTWGNELDEVGIVREHIFVCYSCGYRNRINNY